MPAVGGQAAGTLPSFSWFSPNIEACDHPCHDIAKGERQLKDVFEAVRASPKWDKTMFLVACESSGMAGLRWAKFCFVFAIGCCF